MVVASLMFVALAQTSGPSDMDFWVGSWACTGRTKVGPGKWQQTDAENRIEKTMDGKVVQENFKMGEFIGQSWSVFNAASKRWNQTWVDNQQSYIALTGGKVGDKVILTTLPAAKTPKVFSRMVFSNIKKDSFLWQWQKSTNSGKTWWLVWELNYRRKA